MKTFTATHLNKHAQEVFAAAKDGGAVEIKHDRYEGSFVILHKRQFEINTGLKWEFRGDKDGGC